MDTIKDINKIFEDADLFAEIEMRTDGKVVVSIEWGDWKHEHMYADYLMKQNGYELVWADVTDEDGGDCYSADRYYEKIKKN